MFSFNKSELSEKSKTSTPVKSSLFSNPEKSDVSLKRYNTTPFSSGFSNKGSTIERIKPEIVFSLQGLFSCIYIKSFNLFLPLIYFAIFHTLFKVMVVVLYILHNTTISKFERS